jgi:tripartite-type tricarboxylate transporter receptor subunit TctC
MIKKLKFIFLLFFVVTKCYAQQLIIIPTAPGGSVDTLARRFAQFAELKLNKPTQIENTSGAGGNIGISKFLKSKPNTLMITSGSWYLSILNGAFDLEDFRPVAILAESPFFLITNSSQNLTCEKLKSGNTRYFMGTATMSQTEMVGKYISKKYTNFENVPYKSVKPATLDLLGNHINLAVIAGAENAVHPLVILANSTARKVNGFPSLSECLGMNESGVSADFILVAHKNSSDAFIKDMELVVLEFLLQTETQDYYQHASLHNPNVGLKNIDSKLLEKLNNWKKLTR